MGEGSGVAVSCGVGRRLNSDPALPWLWHRLAAAAPVGPLVWFFSYATHTTLKTKKKKKNSEVLIQATTWMKLEKHYVKEVRHRKKRRINMV